MRIMLADDHELVRDTIISFVQHETGYHIDGACDLPSALDKVRQAMPYDLVLLDYDMPGMAGLDGLSRMLGEKAVASVAILSGNMPSSSVAQAFKLGASGYMPKTMSPASLVAAIRLILAGGTFAPSDLVRAIASESKRAVLPTLSARERVVLRHLCQGMTNVEIARAMRLHEATVKVHVKSICSKVDARNRTHASVIARDAGFF